jgi:hypothetical protein
MGWVCEDHGDRPLMGDSDRADACSFGAGMPCPRCNRDSRHVAHHKHGPALRNEWREAWPTICNWQSLQPSSPRLCSSAVLLLELRKDAITPARQRIPYCGEHCQATERATADIKGHSEAAKYGQPGRLSFYFSRSGCDPVDVAVPLKLGAVDGSIKEQNFV